MLAPPGRVHLIEEQGRITVCGRALTESTHRLLEVPLMERRVAVWCAACYELGSPLEVAELSTRFGLPIPPAEVAPA